MERPTYEIDVISSEWPTGLKTVDDAAIDLGIIKALTIDEAAADHERFIFDDATDFQPRQKIDGRRATRRATW